MSLVLMNYWVVILGDIMKMVLVIIFLYLICHLFFGLKLDYDL